MRGRTPVTLQPLFLPSVSQCLLRTYSVSVSALGARKYSAQQDLCEFTQGVKHMID